jgi:hypothetical protein
LPIWSFRLEQISCTCALLQLLHISALVASEDSHLVIVYLMLSVHHVLPRNMVLAGTSTFPPAHHHLSLLSWHPLPLSLSPQYLTTCTPPLLLLTPAAALTLPSSPTPQTLSASDLSAFKIVDLVEIAGKKGCSPGRNSTRDTVINALVRAGVSINDLSKGQQADLKAKGGASSYSSSPATSSTDRFANYSRSSSASSTPRASGQSGAGLSAGDLSAFKIVDLVEIAAKKGVNGGRNGTRDSLVSALVSAGVSLNDLSRGQLVDLGIKLGKAGLSRDVNQARAELASLIGGSGSASARWVSGGCCFGLWVQTVSMSTTAVPSCC